MKLSFSAILFVTSACSHSAELIEPIVVLDQKSSAHREIVETRCGAKGRIDIIAGRPDEQTLHRYTNESSRVQEIRVDVVENWIAIDYPSISYAVRRDGVWSEIVFPSGSFFTTGASAHIQLEPRGTFSFSTPVKNYIENETTYRLLLSVLSDGQKDCVLSDPISLIE